MALTLPVFTRTFDRWAEDTQVQIIEFLEQEIDGTISYSRISPSIFRYIEIRDVKFVISGLSVNLNRIRIYYRFRDLIQGSLLTTPREIRIDSGEFRVEIFPSESKPTFPLPINPDLVEADHRDALEAISETEKVFQQVFSVIRQIAGPTTVRFRRITLDIFDQFGTSVITRFDQGEADREDQNLTLRAVGTSEVIVKTVPMYSSRFDLRLSSNPFEDEADLFLTVRNISSFLGAFEPVSFQLSLNPQGIQLNKTFDAYPFDLQAVTTLRFDSFEFFLLAEQWNPNSFFSIDSGLVSPQIAGLLDGSLTGTASLFIQVDSLGKALLTYSADLDYFGGIVGTPVYADISVSLVGDTDKIIFDRLVFDGFEQSLLRFAGELSLSSFLPTGTIDFATGTIIPTGEVRGLIQVEPADHRTLIIQSQEIVAFDIPVANPTIRLDLESEGFGFLVDGEFSQTYPEDAAPGKMVAQGWLGNPFELDEDELINSLLLSIQIESANLSNVPGVFALFADPRVLDGIIVSPEATATGSASIFFQNQQPGIIIPELTIIEFTETISRIETQFRYLDEFLIFDQFDLQGSFPQPLPEQLSLEGRGFFGNPDGFSFYVRSFLFEDWIDVQGALVDDQLALQSNLGIQALLSFNRQLPSDPLVSALGLQIFSSKLKVPQGITVPLVNDSTFHIEGFFVDLNRWDLQTLELTLPKIRVPLLSEQGGRIDLRARGTQDQIEILEASYVDDQDIFGLIGFLGINVDPGDGLQISLDFSLEQAITEELITGELNFSLGTLSGSIDSPRIGLQRIPLDGVRGFGQLAANFSLPLEQLELSTIQANLNMNDGLFNLDPLRGSISGQFSNQIAIVDPTEISLADTSFSLRSGFFSLENRSGAVQILVNETTELELALSVPESVGSDDLTGLQGRFRISGIPEVFSPSSHLELFVSGRGRELSFLGGPENSVSGFISLDGDLVLNTKAPMLLQVNARGRIQNGEFDVNIPNARWVNADLASIFDFEIFVIRTGDIEGNLRLVGDINDPSFFGTALVTNVRAGLQYSPQEIGPGSAFIILEDKDMFFPEFQIKAGASLVTIEGVLGFSRWLPVTYEFMFDVPPNPGLQIIQDFDSVIVNGFAHGNIFLSGTPQRVQLSGDITASQAAITLSPWDDEQPTEPGPPAEPNIDVVFTFRSDRAVEFFWPSREFPIFRSFVNPNQEVLFRYNSADASFLLRGTVPVRGGEIFYLDRNFYVRDGSIIFNESQDFFNPRVTLEADSRATWQGQRIVLSITVLEDFLSDLQPRISSNPPLSADALAVIIGGNLFPVAGEQNFNILGEALLTTTDVISQFAIFRNFENQVRNTLRLDLFSIRTGLFQNILRDIVIQDEPVGGYQNLFGRYLQNTTIQMGRIVGNDMFFELLVDISQNDPLANNQQDILGLSINPEFRIEWQLPFVLMEWNWAPTNIQNLFVTDHKFNFLWDFNP
jgi:translocation and assembly module TamB